MLATVVCHPSAQLQEHTAPHTTVPCTQTMLLLLLPPDDLVELVRLLLVLAVAVGVGAV